MGSPEQQRIEDEIRRLETRRAEIERELKSQTSPNLQGTLHEHIVNVDRTLVSLRQQRARELSHN